MLMSGFDYREIRAAAQDAVAIRVGERVKHPHPLAQQISLRDIAEACGVAARPGSRPPDERSLLPMGLITQDFSKALATGVAHLVVRTYEKQAEHLAFCQTVEVKNFRPADIPALDSELDLELLQEHAEIVHGKADFVAVGGSGAVLKTYAKLVPLSRQLVINDSLDGFGRVIASLGASAARLEAKFIAQTLEANGNLDDGQPVFDLSGSNAHGNVCATSLANGLSEAMAMLRTQKTAINEPMNLAAKHLVVAADLEVVAREVIHKWNLDLQISVLVHLPAGRWYVLADKEIHPAIGHLKLEGSKSPVSVRDAAKRQLSSDGSMVKVVADLGAVMLGRTGIVRGGEL